MLIGLVVDSVSYTISGFVQTINNTLKHVKHPSTLANSEVSTANLKSASTEPYAYNKTEVIPWKCARFYRKRIKKLLNVMKNT